MGRSNSQGSGHRPSATEARLDAANAASAIATSKTRIQNRILICWPRRQATLFGSVRVAGLVQAVPELLAGLEERDVLLGNLDAVAGARVAPDPCIAPLDRKRAEAAQLDTVAARQGAGDLVEDRGDDGLDIALVEMRVCRRKLLNKLGFRHGDRPLKMGEAPTVTHPFASVKRRSAPCRPMQEKRTRAASALVLGL